MRDSQYLYGEQFDGTVLRELSYASALYRKIFWSEELVSQLMEVPYTDRDMRRVNASLNAQKHCRSLIEECFVKDKE